MERTIRHNVALCIALVSGLAAAALGQDSKPSGVDPWTTLNPNSKPTTTLATPPASGEKEIPAAPEASRVSGSVKLDMTNAYFFRGLKQEDGGVMLQPAASLTIPMYKDADWSIDAQLSTWNSMHTTRTGASSRSGISQFWYELDFAGGVSVSRGQLTLTTLYNFYTSPNDAFNTEEDIGFTLALDDSEWLGQFALNPAMTLAIETNDIGADGGPDRGVYLEFGIAPGFEREVQGFNVEVAFPVTLGLSLKDYYEDAAGEDDTFGYLSLGARATLPMPCAGPSWSFSAGVNVLFLGDNAAILNNDHDTQVIGSAGMAYEF